METICLFLKIWFRIPVEIRQDLKIQEKYYCNSNNSNSKETKNLRKELKLWLNKMFLIVEK